MKTNSQSPAFPLDVTYDDDCTGLTKREYFAGLAMLSRLYSERWR